MELEYGIKETNQSFVGKRLRTMEEMGGFVRCVTSSHSFTLKMETIRSSETSVFIRVTRRHLTEDDNHHGRICPTHVYTKVEFEAAGGGACLITVLEKLELKYFDRKVLRLKVNLCCLQ
jgi:hypothetical protein